VGSGAAAYRETLKGVLAVLTELDPYSLEPGTPQGFPEDEYEMEAADLTRLLLQNGAVTTRDVDDVWTHWFSEPLTPLVGLPRAARFIDSLNELVAGCAR
jgi:hypothetical protein